MEEEFDKLYRTTSKELFWVAYALVKEQEMAENAVQETFLYVWDHRKELLLSDFLYPYLVKSVKSRALNYLRECHTHELRSARIVDFTVSVSEVDEEEYEQRLELAQKLVEELPERCREIFVKCVIEGMSYQQCADEMNVSVNTVKFHVKAAYDKIRKGAKESNLSVLLLISCL